MNHHLQRTRLVDASHIGSSCIVATLLAISIAVGFNNAAQRGPPDGVEGVEVLTRGPVHEAFVETVTFDPVAGVVALRHCATEERLHEFLKRDVTDFG